MNRILKRLLFILCSFAVFTIAGCNPYPDAEADIEDLDVVVTNYDTKADFSQMKTYAIVDEVSPVTDNAKEGDPHVIDPEFSDYILSIITSNMQALGYEKIDTSANPDIGINVGAAVTRNVTVYTYYPEYYYWYDGSWYYPGNWWGYSSYGYYYPWYPVSYVSSYEIGTLLIDMVDLTSTGARPDSAMNVIWSANLRGIVSSVSSNRARAKTNIDQAFEQSPYLKQTE